jgi:hypothetical protein
MHPWEASYPPECRWDQAIAEGTLPAFLDEVASRFGNLPAHAHCWIKGRHWLLKNHGFGA